MLSIKPDLTHRHPVDCLSVAYLLS